MYKQCKMKMVGSNIFHHAWIPSKLAEVGKVIQFKGEDGLWGKPAWEVVSAGQIGQEGKYVRELERDYLHQRKASDI
jgi:hypothetical protein